MSDCKPEEFLAAAICRLVLDPSAPTARHVAVGAASPVPAAACYLAQKLGYPIRLSLLARTQGNPFSDGTRELFDLTGQGRIDLFFLGGGQIDGEANLNLVGTGEWPGKSVRFPGSFGSAFMYMMTPRIILFREEHSPRVLVQRVDHISATGVSPPGVFRRGHAQALVTGRCVFRFHPDRARFSLASVHAGETVASIRAATGFDFDVPGGDDAVVPQTPAPSEQELALLRGAVCDEMLETYPEFCARVFARSDDRRADPPHEASLRGGLAGRRAGPNQPALS